MIIYNNFLLNLIFKKGSKTMNLLKIRTGGFKNLADSTLELSDLTSLISLNSYGKSNLLTAINFGIDFIAANAGFKEIMMNYRPGMSLNKNNLLQNYFFEFEAQTLLAGIPHMINYRFEFKWGTKHDESAKIISEELKVKECKKNQRYNSFIIRNNKAYYKSSKTSRCATPVGIEDNELVINKLQAYDQLFFLEIVKQINSISVYIDHHLDATSSYEPDPIIRKGLKELDIEGIDNIPRTIFYLKKEHNDKYELLKDAYMQLFPNITNIEVEEIPIEAKGNIPSGDDVPFVFCNNIHALNVTDKSLVGSIEFRVLSDGAKRVFLMLTYAIIADIKGLSLIAFEEPENSIHPSLLQSFLRIIAQLTSNCKVVITSHSPYILQYISPCNIYIGLPNEACLASFKRISGSKIRALEKDVDFADTSIGDYIFELMSAGQYEIEQLKQYLE